MQQKQHLCRRIKYALAMCLLILPNTVAQQHSQPMANRKAISQRVASANNEMCNVTSRNLSSPSVPDFPECKYASRDQECMIKVDRTRLSAVGDQEVVSGTVVHILVYHKSPFEKVRFESERKEVAPPPNPISGIISLISGAAGGITGARTFLGPAAAIASSTALCTSNPDQARLELMLHALIDRIKGAPGKEGRLQEIEEVRAAYDKLGEDLNRFFSRDFCDPNDPALITSVFETERVGYINRICREVTKSSPLSTEGEDQLLKDISELFKRIVLDPNSDQSCIDSETTEINNATGAVRLIREAVAKLDEARKHFADIRDTLIDLEGAQCFQDIRVIADRQADIVGNLVIKNLITGKDDDKKLFTKVKYRDLPRASLSAGVLLSSLEKRKFGVASVFDGPGATDSDSVLSHKEIFGEASRPQVIPFTFVNIRLADWKLGQRLVTFNIAPGVGVNPNSGTTETEFAFGPSFGVGSVYFFGGVHFGRQPDLINGFSVGNRVPDTFVAPVGRSWKTGFGFGVSYRLPLP